jgi:hypothetical protein
VIITQIERLGKPTDESLADDLDLVGKQLKRLTSFTRHLATTDIRDTGTRIHGHLLKARAIINEALRGPSR